MPHVERHGPRALPRLRAAGAAAAATLAWVGSHVRPGMSTAELDRLVRLDTRRRGARPSQLGYHGFPGAVCTSRNDVACHGVPREDEHLESGDVVSIDVTSELDGFHGDTCATFFVGEPSPEARHVVDVALRCRAAGIAAVREGARVGDLGHAMHTLARAEGCDVVRVVGGHGIGRRMHEAPHVPFFGEPGTGTRLKAGMAITIEPIVVLGDPTLVEDEDGWTLRTADGRWAAQFEHSVLVTREGAEILTRA
ncbi:MAG: type I methionyl aminopeptidase [Sandaracinus sp.]|nr:type I methionyl aminopeptidase [Sandaracinus sp.]MCB9633993.1 type I methionyl aminopeptidase [Sandaracinus sp.]